MKPATAALFALLLAGCAAESPQQAKQTDPTCVTVAEAAADFKARHWKAVALTSIQVARAMALSGNAAPAQADGGFLVRGEAPFFAVAFASRGCVVGFVTPFDEEEVLEIVGSDS